jgi:hypothetical protein
MLKEIVRHRSLMAGVALLVGALLAVTACSGPAGGVSADDPNVVYDSALDYTLVVYEVRSDIPMQADGSLSYDGYSAYAVRVKINNGHGVESPMSTAPFTLRVITANQAEAKLVVPAGGTVYPMDAGDLPVASVFRDDVDESEGWLFFYGMTEGSEPATLLYKRSDTQLQNGGHFPGYEKQIDLTAIG